MDGRHNFGFTLGILRSTFLDGSKLGGVPKIVGGLCIFLVASFCETNQAPFKVPKLSWARESFNGSIKWAISNHVLFCLDILKQLLPTKEPHPYLRSPWRSKTLNNRSTSCTVIFPQQDTLCFVRLSCSPWFKGTPKETPTYLGSICKLVFFSICSSRISFLPSFLSLCIYYLFLCLCLSFFIWFFNWLFV